MQSMAEPRNHLIPTYPELHGETEETIQGKSLYWNHVSNRSGGLGKSYIAHQTL